MTFSVNFVEDPFRMHGLQIQSYLKDLPAKQFIPIFTIPSGQRFIITELCSMFDSHLHIRDQATGINRVVVYCDHTDGNMVSFSSGIAFEQGETIEAYASVATSFTLSGYFVDL